MTANWTTYRFPGIVRIIEAVKDGERPAADQASESIMALLREWNRLATMKLSKTAIVTDEVC